MVIKHYVIISNGGEDVLSSFFNNLKKQNAEKIKLYKQAHA